jgi:hypothetical protein
LSRDFSVTKLVSTILNRNKIGQKMVIEQIMILRLKCLIEAKMRRMEGELTREIG